MSGKSAPPDEKRARADQRDAAPIRPFPPGKRWQQPHANLRAVTDAIAIKLRRVGQRRTRLLRRVRPEYEIVISRGGEEVYRGVTTTPSSVLVSHGNVHSTDSWDWIKAADDAYALNSEAWVTEWWS